MDSGPLVLLGLRWLIGDACSPPSSFSACLGNGPKKGDFAVWCDFSFYEGKIALWCLLFEGKLNRHHKMYFPARVLVSKPVGIKVLDSSLMIISHLLGS